MAMICGQCGKPNRDIAKFCKYCGFGSLSAAGGMAQAGQSFQDAGQAAAVNPKIARKGILDGLVGLETIKEELSELADHAEGMKLNQMTDKVRYNTIIIGSSGTAKTLIGKMIADILFTYGMLANNNILTIDAEDLLTMKDPDLEKAFSATARGSVIFIDNAQRLVDLSGGPEPKLNKLCLFMDKYRNDPIVILAGLPYGLREFVKKPENKNITGRFQQFFIIENYTPGQYTEILEHDLAKQGFILSPGAKEQAQKRFRHLYKELKKPDSPLTAINGYLVMREAAEIKASYYKRRATDMILQKEDIPLPVEEKKSLEAILADLEKIIGMDSIKREIKSLHSQLARNADMRERGIAQENPAHHFVITGNPGTGKTTVARQLGAIFEALGLLESGHVVEVDRSQMVAPYIGQTAPKVNALCDQAAGGILFIDEAYTLRQNDNDSFGKEAIDALLKRMEDDRGKFMVIAAGYKMPMEDFLSANEGLKSRFTKRFELEDYRPDELTRIFKSMAGSQKFTLADGAENRVLAFFKDRCGRKTKEFANGREARNLFDEARRNQSDRLSAADGSLSNEDMLRLEPQDIPGTTAEKALSVEEALKELNELTGLASVKEAVRKIINSLESQKLTGETDALSKHFVFTGNPGTGKTTVARILANVFNSIGMLPTNTLVETDRSKLVAGYVGQTAPQVNKVCDNAMGGILFIDEAYTLKQSDNDQSGQEAIDTILKRMEDDRGKFVVIAAGYSKEMGAFISSNSGLQSRFTDFINFEDYKPAEMVSIFTGLAKKKNISFAGGFEEALQQKLDKIYAMRGPSFANARTVRSLFDKTRENLNGRVLALREKGVPEDELKRLIFIMESGDLPGAAEEKSMTLDEALKELNALTGLASVKDAVNKIINTLRVQKVTGDVKTLSKHFVFYGNPGTGKTTVARILANVFKAIGMLPSNTLVEVDRGKMVAGYVGQTAPLVNKVCDSAMGGILFIDEAYSLKHGPQDSFGQEAVDALLKRIEDDRGKYVAIIAGYRREMDEFLATNSGFESRFTDKITFEDYSPPEMREIFYGMAKKQNISFSDGFDEALGARLDGLYAARSASFANARTVRQLFDKSKENLDTRIVALADGGAAEDDLKRESRVMRTEDLDKTVTG